LRFSSHAKPFLPPNHGYHARALPLSDKLQHCILCIEFQRRLDLRVSFLTFLHVRAGRVEAALRWLKANNYLYHKTLIDSNKLASLPEDGMPNSWLCVGKSAGLVANVAAQVGLECEWLNITYFVLCML
jgi:hypothetical protein